MKTATQVLDQFEHLLDNQGQRDAVRECVEFALLDAIKRGMTLAAEIVKGYGPHDIYKKHLPNTILTARDNLKEIPK